MFLLDHFKTPTPSLTDSSVSSPDYVNIRKKKVFVYGVGTCTDIEGSFLTRVSCSHRTTLGRISSFPSFRHLISPKCIRRKILRNC